MTFEMHSMEIVKFSKIYELELQSKIMNLNKFTILFYEYIP